MIDTEHLLAIPALRACIVTAVDAGLTGAGLALACLPQWNACYACTDVRVPDVQLPADGSLIDRQRAIAHLERSVAIGPRGTWGVVWEGRGSAPPGWIARMHDGRGGMGHRYSSGDPVDAYAELRDEMMAHEITRAAAVVWTERDIVAARTVAAALGLEKGLKLGDVRFQGETYAETIVETYEPATGRVLLSARSGQTRTRFSMRASRLPTRIVA